MVARRFLGLIFALSFLAFGPNVEAKDAGEPADSGDSRKVSNSEAKGIKALLSAPSTECQYAALDDLNYLNPRVYQPEIVDLPDPCSKTADGLKSACIASIYCKSDLTNFVVSNAVCWSESNTGCPPARECAKTSLLSFSTPAQISFQERMPVYYDRKYSKPRGKAK